MSFLKPFSTNPGGPITKPDGASYTLTFVEWSNWDRPVQDDAERDAMPMGEVLYFGRTCGERTHMQTVTYPDGTRMRREIPGFEAMSDAQKLVELARNDTWQPVTTGGSSAPQASFTVLAPNAAPAGVEATHDAISQLDGTQIVHQNRREVTLTQDAGGASGTYLGGHGYLTVDNCVLTLEANDFLDVALLSAGDAILYVASTSRIRGPRTHNEAPYQGRLELNNSPVPVVLILEGGKYAPSDIEFNPDEGQRAYILLRGEVEWTFDPNDLPAGLEVVEQRGTLVPAGGTDGQVLKSDGAGGLYWADDEAGAGGGPAYTLPAATYSALGGVIVGAGLTVAGDGTLSRTAATKAEVGLANVDNTSDVGKPVSTAQAAAIALKADIAAATSNSMTLAFDKERVHGTAAAPLGGGAFALDTAGAKLGVVVMAMHQAGAEPTYPAAFKRLAGSGNYKSGALNFYMLMYLANDQVLYSVSQQL
ncbi:hypothetical protein [Hymenobacter sp. B81]|uniref:hypothetical protein n=1 Tax=Hymenobacter sp. B81 TaxID=3344878 RepID=UPI0037DC8AF9